MNYLLRPRISPSFLASSGVGPCDVPFRYGNQSLGAAGRLPGGTSIFVVSRQQFMKYPIWCGVGPERRVTHESLHVAPVRFVVTRAAPVICSHLPSAPFGLIARHSWSLAIGVIDGRNYLVATNDSEA